MVHKHLFGWVDFVTYVDVLSPSKMCSRECVCVCLVCLNRHDNASEATFSARHKSQFGSNKLNCIARRRGLHVKCMPVITVPVKNMGGDIEIWMWLCLCDGLPVCVCVCVVLNMLHVPHTTPPLLLSSTVLYVADCRCCCRCSLLLAAAYRRLMLSYARRLLFLYVQCAHDAWPHRMLNIINEIQQFSSFMYSPLAFFSLSLCSPSASFAFARFV